MPTLDLILLPLLGGYIFLSIAKYFKFYHQRVESQRLLLNSLIVGVLLTIVALGIDFFYLKPVQPLRNFLKNLFPLKHAGVNLSILILFISYPLGLLWNWIFDEHVQLNKVIDVWGDDYEKLFWNSMKETNLRKKFIMLTTENDKVYVGYISNISQPIGNAYVKIIPYFSGYRDGTTREFVITTDYFETLENLLTSGNQAQIDDVLGIIIPKEKIIIASKFDFAVYRSFINPVSPTPPATATP